MSLISLHAEGLFDVTIIPNIFIDQYMPSANGAFVKVYLYLLRCFYSNSADINISSIADHLEDTEKDVVRALNYWEKLGLLSIGRNAKKEIETIQFKDIKSLQHRLSPLTEYEQAVELTAATMEKDALESNKDILSKAAKQSVSANYNKKTPEKQNYPAEKVAKLTENEEIQYILHVVELYLDRPLKPMDIQLVLYLSEELHFSAELIMYLYEYCVSKGKRNASYVEAVALTWAEEGIDTEEKAKEITASYNEHFNAVNKAFGLNRAPGQIERQYISKWVEFYGFTDELIMEACNRTILRTQKPDFKYADKILETWYNKGAKSNNDIIRLDEEFTKGNKKSENTSKVSAAKPGSNRFNQFPQRTYSAQDYADLERKLINKGL